MTEHLHSCFAIGSGETLGMELVRALIPTGSALGWAGLLWNDRKTRPDIVLELVASAEGNGAWLVFTADQVPEVAFSRELTKHFGATLELVRFDYDSESGRARFSQSRIAPDGAEEELAPDSYDTAGDEAGNSARDYVRGSLIASLDFEDRAIKRTEFPYTKRKRSKRRAPGE